MHAFSVTVVGVVIEAGAVYVFGPLVPDVGDPCTLIVVLDALSEPGAAFEGDGDNVQVKLFAMPSFWIDAENDCVLPPVKAVVTVCGLSVIEVTGTLTFVLVQTGVATGSATHACTTTLGEG